MFLLLLLILLIIEFDAMKVFEVIVRLNPYTKIVVLLLNTTENKIEQLLPLVVWHHHNVLV